MATADTAAARNAAPAPQALQFLTSMSQRQQLAAAAAIALAISMLVGVWLWSRTPDYAVMFANLDEREGGTIIAALQQQNVPYKVAPGGTAIMVPATMVHEVRLRLAAQGLPKGGLVGFEIMEDQKLGVSQFLEQVNYQRALEGELARTIQSIGSVASARVHLAIPKQTGFLRDEQKPSASVMVNLYAGRGMEPSQIAGIVHLIASSVPRMANDKVSVIDQNGKLLTSSADPTRNAGLDSNQLSFVRQVESAYISRIESILAPIVGAGNFKAEVAADLDFNQVEETAESFKPNPSPDQAIRSQQTTEQQTRDAGAQGVPGALSNQPPVPATAPVTQPADANATGSGALPLSANRSAVLNYELDRTIQHTRQAPGQIRRLSVAVVVNHRTQTLPNGQTRTTPLSDDEMARVTSLVREAMGFNQARGDSLNVSAAPFAAVEAEELVALPIWKDPELLALGKELLKYLVLAAVLALVYFNVIKPLVRAAATPPKHAGKAGAEDEEEEDEADAKVTLSALKMASFEERLARARELAKNDPKVVANLIKDWLGTNEESKK